jgi:hypothetical protein
MRIDGVLAVRGAPPAFRRPGAMVPSTVELSASTSPLIRAATQTTSLDHCPNVGLQFVSSIQIRGAPFEGAPVKQGPLLFAADLFCRLGHRSLLLELYQAVSDFSLKRLLLGGSQEMRGSHHARAHDIMRARSEDSAIKYRQVIIALVCIVYDQRKRSCEKPVAKAGAYVGSRSGAVLAPEGPLCQ